MVDTIRFRVECSDTSHLPARLTGVSERLRVDTGELKHQGYLDNLRLWVEPNRVSVEGSIVRFHLNNGLAVLTRSEFERAVEHLSDSLSIPISEGKIGRLDFGVNVLLDHPIQDYTALLGELKRFTRHTHKKDGLLYWQNQGELAVYNKVKQLISGKLPFDAELKQANIARFERRLTKHPATQLRVERVTLGMLCKEQGYSDLVKLFERDFNRISRKRCMKLLSELPLSGLHDLHSAGLAFAMQFPEFEEALRSRILSEHKASNKRRQRLLKRLEEVSNTEVLSESNELISELDHKMVGALAAFR